MQEDSLWQYKYSGTHESASSQGVATLESLVRHLELTQWWSAASLEQEQFRFLRATAGHLEKHSPWFAARLAAAGLRADALDCMDSLRRLPLLTRRSLQENPPGFVCQPPTPHLPLWENRTSGSTGEPVIVQRTKLCRLYWLANSLRRHFWQERDFSLRMTSIRAQITEYLVSPFWSPPASLLFPTGSSQFIPISTPLPRVVELIQEFQPHVLVLYPNVLRGLLQLCREQGLRFNDLRLIRCAAETLTPELKSEATAWFGAQVTDNYSSREFGVIAIQCPAGEGLHVMSESVLVEVLDEEGEPCAPGTIGQIVLTDLHNYASPMIRYAIRDFASLENSCPCGRGLPLLRRVMGRDRNLVTLPNGTRHWPLVGFAGFRDIAPVQQYQLIQHNTEQIEVRLVTEVPLTVEQEAGLRALIIQSIGHPFTLNFVYFSGPLPRPANGKFADFECLVNRA